MEFWNTVLQFTWCLPQTILALIIRGLGHEDIVGGNFVPVTLVEVRWLKESYFSLGMYVFVTTDWYKYSNDYILHEYGHSRQSLILGPLYLIVIGLPSLVWNTWYYRIKGQKKHDYYWFYTEKWANKLAGIEM